MKPLVYLALLLTVQSLQASQIPSKKPSRTTSVRANLTPVQANRTPFIQENRTPSVEANRTLLQANRTLLQASRTPVQANRTPSVQANRTLVQANRTLVQASRTPVQASRTPSVQENWTSSVQASRTPVQASRTPSVQENRTLFKQTTRTGAEECTFQTSQGYVDLTPLVNQNGTARFSTQASDYEYQWNPCRAFSVDQVCQNVAVCQRVLSTNFYVLLARQDGLVLDKEGQLMLSYTGTDPTDMMTRQTYISLICDSTIDGEFKFECENPVREYHFTLRSKYACERHKPVTGLLTTPSPTPGPAPSPAPPVISLPAVVVLLVCILVSLCILNCMVFLGLVTRRRRSSDKGQVHGHFNQAFEKKLPMP